MVEEIAKLKNANGNANDSLKSSEQKLKSLGEKLAAKVKDYDNLVASTTAVESASASVLPANKCI